MKYADKEDMDANAPMINDITITNNSNKTLYVGCCNTNKRIAILSGKSYSYTRSEQFGTMGIFKKQY